MSTYYLWSGIGAIEDLEDCTTDEEAKKSLQMTVAADWTLWKRTGMSAKLLAVKMEDPTWGFVDLFVASRKETSSETNT
jgi:hypothetical protein